MVVEHLMARLPVLAMRERLVSKPLPSGWEVRSAGGLEYLAHGEHGRAGDAITSMESPVRLDAEIRYHRAQTDAYEWLKHEAAVRAQDGVP